MICEQVGLPREYWSLKISRLTGASGPSFLLRYEHQFPFPVSVEDALNFNLEKYKSIKGLSLYSEERKIWLIFVLGQFLEVRNDDAEVKSKIADIDVSFKHTETKTLLQRQGAILEIIACPQGAECTTGCPQRQAQELRNKGFTSLELVEARRLMVREKIEIDHNYLDVVFSHLEALELSSLDSELRNVLDEFERGLAEIELDLAPKYIDQREFEKRVRKFSTKKLTAAQVHLLHADGERISYFDFLAATDFKPIVEMDLCFFLKNPLEMNLDEFRYFLMYSSGDFKFAQAFRRKNFQDYPELHRIYEFVHAGVMISNYAELKPLLDKFHIELTETEHYQLQDL